MHQQVEAMLGLEAARARAHVEHGHAGGLVDEDRRVVELARGDRDRPPVAVGEVAAAQLREVGPRLRAQQALDELVARHFEAEHADLAAVQERRVLGDVERERRLAHARAAGDDDEIARLQAGGLVVEVGEARGHAGDVLALVEQLLDLVHVGMDQILDRREPLLRAFLADLEDARLGAIEDVLGLVAPA
jgi:hypothetical protein